MPIPASPAALGERRGPIVVAGNLSLDDTVNPLGETPDAPGGDALYAALGARLWGADVTILTLAGEDYPDQHVARMAELGIGTELIRRIPGPTMHYRVTDDADGNRTYEYLTDPDRLSATSPQSSDFAGIEGAGWLHLAAMPIEAHELGVAAARRFGIPYSLDPHEEYVVGYESRLRDLVAGATFMPSELEATLLLPGMEPGPDPVRFGATMTTRLAAWSPAVLAIKLGRSGSIVQAAGEPVHVPALEVDVVDPIGAGDAYCGGFVAGLRGTGSIVVAAACGTVSAAHVITQYGAFRPGPMPGISSLVEQARSLLADLPDLAAGERNSITRLAKQMLAAP